MIITRTPYRISFFGGGTDYPVWWKQHGGAVLGTTINHYCYITCTPRLPFFDFRHIISWSKYEAVRELDEIEHPAVREAFRFLDIDEGLDVRTVGELPARSGLGASSAFTVGLLNALHAMRGEDVSGLDLAREAIHVEQDLIQEHVGCQDQVLAACGGLSRVDFEPDGEITVSKVDLPPEQIEEFEDRLLLVFTGTMREASTVAQVQIESTNQRERELMEMRAAVDEGLALLKSADWTGFGELLHHTWQIKRSLTQLITSSEIDDIYEAARDAGATGGKLIGAGGGGFMLLFVEPGSKQRVADRLGGLIHVQPHLETEGSKVVLNTPPNGEGKRAWRESIAAVMGDSGV